jgi:alkylation response protein AidB-like acyl-CoA dehydrogenase
MAACCEKMRSRKDKAGGPDTYEETCDRLEKLIWLQLAPIVTNAEQVGAPLWPQMKDLLADAGVLGLLIPAKNGGSGLTVRQYLPVISEFAKLHRGLRLLVHVHCSFTYLLARIGSEKQRSALLGQAAIGNKSLPSR